MTEHIIQPPADQHQPPADQQWTPQWTPVGQIGDVPRQGARVVKTPAGDIAVFRSVDDQLFAVMDRCPHKGGPLSQGIVHGRRVTCPLHNWVIDLATGQAQAPDEGCAGTVPLRVNDGRIELALPAVSAISAAANRECDHG